MAFISHTSWGQHPTVQNTFHLPSSEVDFQLNIDISINQELRMALCAYFLLNFGHCVLPVAEQRVTSENSKQVGSD